MPIKAFFTLKDWPNRLANLQAFMKGFVKNRQYERDRISFIQQVAGASNRSIRRYVNEIHDDFEFIGVLRRELQLNSIYEPSRRDFMLSHPGGSMFFYCVLLYAIVRLLKPKVIVETGGTPGKTSAFFLQAMERNGFGHLYTIDFPPTSFLPPEELRVSKTHEFLPEGKGSGWIVPNGLKHRHELIVGKSSEHLQPLLDSLGEIDIFLHDSLHSYENMLWEFRTAWPHIWKGGLLLSDDILSNVAFRDFCKEKRVQAFTMVNLGAVPKL